MQLTSITVPPLINPSPTCTPLSASDAHVYTRNLLLAGHGCPLYVPEPTGHSAVYRTKGVRIGDVGFVTEDGLFQMLFNIRAPAQDPINCYGVPNDFEQLPLGLVFTEAIPSYFVANRVVTSVGATRLDLDPSRVSSQLCYFVVPSSYKYSLVTFLPG